MAILTAPAVHPSLAMGLERKTVIMLSSVIATDHTSLYLDIRKIHQSNIDTHCTTAILQEKDDSLQR